MNLQDVTYSHIYFVGESTHVSFRYTSENTCWRGWAKKPLGLLSKSVFTRLRAASAGAKQPVTKHFVLWELAVPADSLDALGQGGYVVQARPWDHVVPNDHTHAEFLAFF